ncbi:MAG: hypothetical protein QXQ82_02720 [Candidatus Pacearchaeota archaeon]
MKKLIIANKIGISELISYVLLTVMAIALASGVYFWIKSRIPVEQEECPEGLSMIIAECNLSGSELNITFKNNGNFNITGAFVYVRLKDNSTKKLEDFPPNLKNAVEDVLSIEEEKSQIFDVSSIDDPANNITHIEFIPVKNLKNTTVLCKKQSYPFIYCSKQ